MDNQRKMYARLTIGEQSSDLGTTSSPLPIETLCRRFAAELRVASGRAKQIIFHLSQDQIDESHQSYQARLEHEFNSMILSPEASAIEEWRPGISYAEMAEAVGSDEYRNLTKAIESNTEVHYYRARWQEAYPLVSQHLPPKT